MTKEQKEKFNKYSVISFICLVVVSGLAWFFISGKYQEFKKPEEPILRAYNILDETRCQLIPTDIVIDIKADSVHYHYMTEGVVYSFPIISGKQLNQNTYAIQHSDTLWNAYTLISLKGDKIGFGRKGSLHTLILNR